jgi:hypothetical protein
MAAFIPPIILLVAKAAVVAVNFISGIGATIASAASALPASVAVPISKATAVLVNATPPGVRDFVSNAASKVVETGKKLQEFVNKNTPQTGTSEATAFDDASRVKEAADKANKAADVADNVSKLVGRLEENHKSGDSITPSSETTATVAKSAKSVSDTPQRDKAISEQPALGAGAKEPVVTSPHAQPSVLTQIPDNEASKLKP